MYKGNPAEEDLYRALVDLGLKSGAKMLVAKVNAHVFMEPGPISMEDLAERTGYSLSSISSTVKHLELLKKLRRIKEPGSKRIFVQGEKNLIETLHQQLRHAIDIAINPMQDQLPETIKELRRASKKTKSKDQKKRVQEKIDWYQDYLKQAEELLRIFTIIDHEFSKTKKEYRQAP